MSCPPKTFLTWRPVSLRLVPHYTNPRFFLTDYPCFKFRKPQLSADNLKKIKANKTNKS